MSPSTEVRENREFAAEMKFLVPRGVAARVREWARARLQPDPNATSGNDGDEYLITSLYFDTKEFSVFHRRGSYGRSKYRVRRYGASPSVFLERKLKTRGLVSKRRSAVSMTDLPRLHADQPERNWIGYWYHQRLLLRKLEAVCQISYQRMARVAPAHRGSIRLTVDENLCALPASQIAVNGSDEGGTALLEDSAIIEMKYCGDVPVLFKQLVEEFSLNAQPVSKYRLAVAKLGFATGSVLEDSDESNTQPGVCLNS